MVCPGIGRPPPELLGATKDARFRTDVMTRIASGTVTPNPTPVDETLTHTAGATLERRAAVSAPATQPRAISPDASVDRPAPQPGDGPKHGPIDLRTLCANLLH